MSGFKRELQEREDRDRVATSLAELAAQGVNVFCWCNRCGHNATLPIARLLGELGPHYAVPEIGVRLRCSGCGSKDVATRPDWPGLGQVTRHQKNNRTEER